jgi:hypothetical protein
MATYDEFQQLYCLSAASMAVGGLEGTEQALEETMNTTLRTYIPQLTGNWRLAWGPRVFKSEKDNTSMGPDNAWFAAVSDTQKILTVAVAGTSPSSIPGWIIDFDVTSVVDFSAWTTTWATEGIQRPTPTSPEPGRAYASTGTCTGVFNVLSNASRLEAYGQLLGDYIANSVPSDYRVIFTGHSMGGAVAPTVALGLVQANKSPSGRTFILPSAGATPGNAELVQEFTAIFPPGPTPPPAQPYAVLNTDFFNILDIVPQAWSLDATSARNINNILNIYSNASAFMKLVIGALVRLFSDAPPLSGITYEPLAGTSFVGPPIQPVSSKDELTAAVLIEHTTAYWKVLGIESWVQKVSDKLLEHPGVRRLPVQSVIPPALEGETIPA